MEAACDRIVQRRLATDRAYKRAADAEAQAEREQQIADETWTDLLLREG